MKQSGYINNLDNGFFMCALFIGIILAVFCSLFIGTEHNDGKFIDNQTKATQVSQYELVLQKDSNWKIVE